MIARRQLPARLLVAAGIGLVAAALLPGPPAQAQPSQPAVAAQPAVAQAPAPVAQDGQGTIETPYGPLTEADRDLLVRVRYAGLWEVPAGTMAAEKGTTEQVREIGTYIAEEHVQLDEAVLAIAAELQVALPTEPHPDNQVFLDRMARFEGEDFDFEFIQRLREAHGDIYPLIAYVRAGTHNDKIREFANVGEEFVGRHMDYLESSGLVDWLLIAPPPEPHGTKSRFLSSAPGGVEPLLIWLILGAAAVAGTITVVRTVRPR